MSTTHTVIIADRDPIVSSALRVEFSRCDLLVLLAGSAPEAEAYARQVVASLVVLDIGGHSLPMLEACARIRRQLGYEACPIVLTGRPLTEPVRQAAATAGATCTLEKDYAFADLINAVLPHVPADHPVARQLGRGPGMAQTQQVWTLKPSLNWRFGGESSLAGNARVMPVLRGQGVRVPVLKGRVS
jgi:DNA-binding response OmpR family regulator